MPNIGGPVQFKRKLLGSVVGSRLQLYTAPVWIHAITNVARTRTSLIRPQRTAVPRVIRSYRTVSDEAALVLACTSPADLTGLERCRIRSRLRAATEPGQLRPSKAAVKQEGRKATIALWQVRWLATKKASWTRRAIPVIPDIGRWLGRTVPWVPLSFHMTHALSGHGCFQFYLHRMARAASSRCWQCSGDSDTAEHTLFECVYWEGFRVHLSARLGRRPSVADLPDIICGPAFEMFPADPEEKSMLLREAEEVFRLFYKMVEDILSAKQEEEERARQAAEEHNVGTTNVV
ncbi:uncharacterized protein LOC111028869 [Myzus persicae]|uniref:uncharacterized protein LOC111028869 n=1 Tax=Myzus persicae TaxID=13164 RepID=UPI000B93930C|nr:uncharacterized protein LOC111028869 [Myzus persicae]